MWLNICHNILGEKCPTLTEKFDADVSFPAFFCKPSEKNSPHKKGAFILFALWLSFSGHNTLIWSKKHLLRTMRFRKQTFLHNQIVTKTWQQLFHSLNLSVLYSHTSIRSQDQQIKKKYEKFSAWKHDGNPDHHPNHVPRVKDEFGPIMSFHF